MGEQTFTEPGGQTGAKQSQAGPHLVQHLAKRVKRGKAGPKRAKKKKVRHGKII